MSELETLTARVTELETAIRRLRSGGGIDTAAIITNLEIDIAGRLQGVPVEAYSAPIIGDPFVVRHILGRTPLFIVWLPQGDVRIWANEDDKRVWSAEMVRLRCSGANLKLNVLVI